MSTKKMVIGLSILMSMGTNCIAALESQAEATWTVKDVASIQITTGPAATNLTTATASVGTKLTSFTVASMNTAGFKYKVCAPSKAYNRIGYWSATFKSDGSELLVFPSSTSGNIAILDVNGCNGFIEPTILPGNSTKTYELVKADNAPMSPGEYSLSLTAYVVSN